MSKGWWKRPLCQCGREWGDCQRELGLPCTASDSDVRAEIDAKADDADREMGDER